MHMCLLKQICDSIYMDTNTTILAFGKDVDTRWRPQYLPGFGFGLAISLACLLQTASHQHHTAQNFEPSVSRNLSLYHDFSLRFLSSLIFTCSFAPKSIVVPSALVSGSAPIAPICAEGFRSCSKFSNEIITLQHLDLDHFVWHYCKNFVLHGSVRLKWLP